MVDLAVVGNATVQGIVGSVQSQLGAAAAIVASSQASTAASVVASQRQQQSALAATANAARSQAAATALIVPPPTAIGGRQATMAPVPQMPPAPTIPAPTAPLMPVPIVPRAATGPVASPIPVAPRIVLPPAAQTSAPIVPRAAPIPVPAPVVTLPRRSAKIVLPPAAQIVPQPAASPTPTPAAASPANAVQQTAARVAEQVASAMQNQQLATIRGQKEIAEVYARQAQVLGQVKAAVDAGSMSAQAAEKMIGQAAKEATRRLTEQGEVEKQRQQASTIGAMADAAANRGALARIAGEQQVGREYDKLANTIGSVWDQFKKGQLTAESAQTAIRIATQKTTEALAQQRQAATALVNAQNAVATVYGSVTGTIMSYVRAGMAGTAQGNMIALQFQTISREVANLFLPVINQVVSSLIRVSDWFRRLSGDQQENIARWVLVGVAALGTANYLPKVAAGFQVVGLAIKAMMMGNPLGLILTIATGAVAMLASTEKGRESLVKLGKALAPIGQGFAEGVIPILDTLSTTVTTVATTLTTWTTKLSEALRYVNQINSAAGQGQQDGNALAVITRFFVQGNPISALSPLFSTGQQVRESSSRPHQQLDVAGGGFSGVQETFRRLQTAANQTDIPREQLEVQRESRELLREIARRPVVRQQLVVD